MDAMSGNWDYSSRDDFHNRDMADHNMVQASRKIGCDCHRSDMVAARNVVASHMASYTIDAVAPSSIAPSSIAPISAAQVDRDHTPKLQLQAQQPRHHPLEPERDLKAQTQISTHH